jgi:hypothetical protein
MQERRETFHLLKQIVYFKLPRIVGSLGTVETREVLGSPYAVFKPKRLRAKVLGIHVRSLNHLKCESLLLDVRKLYSSYRIVSRPFFANVNTSRFDPHYSDGGTRLDSRAAVRKDLAAKIQSAILNDDTSFVRTSCSTRRVRDRP